MNIPDTKSAIAQKSIYSPAFSKKAVRRAKISVHSVVAKSLNILQEAAQKTRIVDLSMGFKCLTADAPMNFVQQCPLGVLDTPDFQAPFIRAMEDLARTKQYIFYFPKAFKTASDFERADECTACRG